MKTASPSEAVEASLLVEAVKSSGSTLVVYVRNLGDAPILVTGVYVVDPKTRNCVYAATDLRVEVPPKALEAIAFSVDVPLKGYYMVEVFSRTSTTALTYYLQISPVFQGAATPTR